MTETEAKSQDKKSKISREMIVYLILVLILIAAAILRFTGIDWGEGAFLHPDEGFLANVQGSISTVATLGEYWDTEHSTLNPHNVGHGFYVYGTYPLILSRYIAEWKGELGREEMMVIGRSLSALADVFTVFVVFLVAERLFDRRVGLFAAAFSAFSVLPIQLSHYLAVDTFLTLFITLSVYFAVRVMQDTQPSEGHYFRPRYFVLFGIAFGMSYASKIHLPPVAFLLPLAVVVRVSQLERHERLDAAWESAGYLILGAVSAFLTFRIFQPYAFKGPGFFGMLPNDKWIDNIVDLGNQLKGDLDWPPSFQWARRPIWYSIQNLVLWGLGVPMSIAAWGGFLWAGWKMLTGKWRTHILIWSWIAGFFVWHLREFNPTMRYEIPIYSMLAVYAGWAVVSLWDASGLAKRWRGLLRSAAGLAGMASLVLTALYAFAFIQIYQRPITRLEASRWIYQNIPGPLNLQIETGEGTYQQPIAIPYSNVISEDTPYIATFISKETGTINEITYKTVSPTVPDVSLFLWLSEADALDVPIYTAEQRVSMNAINQDVTINFSVDNNPILLAGRQYLLRVDLLSLTDSLAVNDGFFVFNFLSGEGSDSMVLESPVVLSASSPFEYTFTPPENVTLSQVYLTLQPAGGNYPDSQTLQLSFSNTPDFATIAATSEVTVNLSNGANSEGGIFVLSQPVDVVEEATYYLRLENLTPGGRANLTGSAIANETSWDPGLPYSLDGYSGYNGTYLQGMEFQITDDGTPEKLARMLNILDNVEYIAISSSRQWASTIRIPERFPINLVYYRALVGCPDELGIEACYNVAQSGMFKGQLGFELIEVFQSNPSIGNFEINDQPSDEAFTVYDHPKVFIFKKTADYNQEAVAAILNTADLENFVHLTPKQAGEFKSLLLSPEATARQEKGGTWAYLFNSSAWYNRSGIGAVVLWYLTLSLLGWMVFPLVRRALPGLPDFGFPLARTAAMLLLAYFSWLAGSVGLGYSRLVILTVFAVLALLGLWQAVRQWDWLKETLRENWRQFLIAEAVFLGAFLLVLLVRYGNPDLWHPFKGGEKPMDFAYFNAILKSVAFPAYDPWYAGGYINYYYFGFVFVGTLVKMLGIEPALAYNIVLPTIFAMLFSGAFSVVWNIYRSWQYQQDEDDLALQTRRVRPWPAWAVALGGALLTGVLGNLGTVAMIFEGMQRLAGGEAYTDFASFFLKIKWTFQGFWMMTQGGGWPFGGASWYWEPSRVIPALGEPEPITEFPWFTTIYADLHAHFMALALVFLALAWALSVVFSRAWKNASRWQIVWSFVFAGVAIGSLRPTNTWDLPTYLALGVIAIVYAVIRYVRLSSEPGGMFPSWLKKAGLTVGAVLALVVLTFALYQPFAKWYGLPYSEVKLWEGSHTIISAFFVHWGLFLFVLVFWMGWETRQWMASTPLSSLRKLEKYKTVIYGVLGVLAILTVALFFLKVRIHLIALPLAVWAAVLLLRPGLSESKRIVLFFVGTALFLTILVEVIVLSGDIGRMNTVFKFYLQAWVLLAASSAAAFGWTLAEAGRWPFKWSIPWRLGLVVLVGCAALFPLTATTAKIQDRMAVDAPHTLDGMAYMEYSLYPDEGGVVDLSQDYHAIRWMQENVPGTPVIVEANTPLYRWGSRYSIYTGLPTVLGWDWHQTQQRGFVPTSEISLRQSQIKNFYLTVDWRTASQFLLDYHVEYIVVGQLERNYYPGPGLDKFEQFNGSLWQEVYRDGQTVIYKVIDPIAIEQE